MTMQVISKWTRAPADPELESYNFGFMAALQPYVGVRSYYNYIDSDMPGGAVPSHAYWGPNLKRLKEIREKYVDVRTHMGEEWELLDERPGMKMGLAEKKERLDLT